MTKTGRTGRGWRKGYNDLTDDQVKEIRRRYREEHLSMKDLAKIYHVGASTIHRYLIKGTTNGSNPVKRRPVGPLGSGDVPTSQIVELREVQGLSFYKIAKKVAMSQQAVNERYRNYKRGASVT